MTVGLAARVRVQRQPSGEGFALPAPATAGSAGLDLAAAVDGEVVIAPGDRVLIPTGFAFAIPEGFEAQIRPRSGLALEHGLVHPNAPGTIDSDYRGVVQVILMILGRRDFVVRRGDRIAQMVVAPVVDTACEEVTELDQTHRGSGGFGHTGRSGGHSEGEGKTD